MEYLRRRREFLVSQAAAQRSEVAYLAAHLQRHLQLVDGVIAIGKKAPILPLLALAGTLLLVRAPHKKIWLWGGRLFAAWRLFLMARRRWSAS